MANKPRWPRSPAEGRAWICASGSGKRDLGLQGSVLRSSDGGTFSFLCWHKHGRKLDPASSCAARAWAVPPARGVSYGHAGAHVSLGRSWIPGVRLTGPSSLAAESGQVSADRGAGTGGDLMDALSTDSC